MRAISLIHGLSCRRWRRGHALALRLAGCFCSVVVASGFIRLSSGSDNQPGANPLWVANGVLLAYFLLTPRWRWPLYGSVGFAALVTGGLLIDGRIVAMNLPLNCLNVGEVAVAAFFLRRRSTMLPEFTSQAYLLRFGFYALVLGPSTAGIVFTLFSGSWGTVAMAHAFFGWSAIDSLGTAVATPAFVAILSNRLLKPPKRRHYWLYPALLIAITVLAFSYAFASLLPMIFPLLILTLVTLGLGWASLGTLFVAAVGGWFGAHRADSILPAGMPGSTVALQSFVASAMFMLYTVSAVLERRLRAERGLSKIASLHALVTDNSRDAILIVDADGNPSYASPAIERITGLKPADTAGHGFAEMVHPDDLSRFFQALERLKSGADGVIVEHRIRSTIRGFVWVEGNMRVFVDPLTGRPAGTLAILRDISERKAAEHSRAFHDSLIRAIQEVSLDGILAVDVNGQVVSVNERLAEVWRLSKSVKSKSSLEEGSGYPDETLLSQCLEMVRDEDRFRKRVKELYEHPEEEDESQIELKDGRTLERYSTSLRTRTGDFLGRVWFFRDISERRLAEKKLQDAYHAVESLAATDALTGLANRRRFDECLASEWRRGMRHSQSLSMLLMDVDLFKSYNDTYGHVRGDNCLRLLAEAAIDVVVRPGDLVARFGGEEFAVILPNTSRVGAREVADSICAEVRRRGLKHSGNPTGILTVSVGCGTVVPVLGQHVVQLIEMADAALYDAKRNGRNRVCSRSAVDEGPMISTVGEPKGGVRRPA